MLKFAVSVMLAAFGAYWLAEGLGIVWPGGVLAIIGLALAWLVLALFAVVALRHRAVIPRPGTGAR
jgi:Ca2+/H+ antiporter, TMEM165/GDT1 family